MVLLFDRLVGRSSWKSKRQTFWWFDFDKTTRLTNRLIKDLRGGIGSSSKRFRFSLSEKKNCYLEFILKVNVEKIRILTVFEVG